MFLFFVFDIEVKLIVGKVERVPPSRIVIIELSVDFCAKCDPMFSRTCQFPSSLNLEVELIHFLIELVLRVRSLFMFFTLFEPVDTELLNVFWSLLDERLQEGLKDWIDLRFEVFPDVFFLHGSHF